MARTELPHGVILPAEYSDDWYEDMTSNLTKLDDVIGSDSEKLNSNDVAFLRMSSAALTDGGTGNFSDLNSSNKLKTGDYVLDSGRKLYQVVSVDSTNETFTVGNSLFKITAESDLAPVAESGDYDDLDNKPDLNPYDQHIANTDIHVTAADKTKWNNGVTQAYVFRYSGTAVVPNSTIAYSTIDNTDNIKTSDKIIDVDGKIFSIVSVDTANQTVTVGAVLLTLALDSNVMHLSGNETAAGEKTFSTNLTSPGLRCISSTETSGQGSSILSLYSILTFLNGDPSITARLNFRILGSDGSKSLYPHETNQYVLGLTSRRFANTWTNAINALNPGALSFPDLSSGLDISSYFTLDTSSNTYTPSVDGWICIKGVSSGTSAIYVESANGFYASANSIVDINSSTRFTNLSFPVVKDEQYTIVLKSINTSISAKFFPCQGNI